MNYLNTLTRISKILGVVLLTVFLTSCDDFLTESPQSEVGVTDFYKTRDDFVQAVNDIYHTQQSLYTGNQFYILGDLRSDNIVGGLVDEGNYAHGQEEIDQFNMTPDNNTLEPNWGTHYGGIAKANRVITKIKGADIKDKEVILGQAQALRGLFYFNLVRIFGKVQLVTEPDIDINTERVSVDSVYTQIISDLTDAASNLPESYSSDDNGRITKGAAQSLLGEVYLTRQNFTDAEAIFKEVVQSKNYSLQSDYGDLWISSKQGEESESVWRVVYRKDEKGNGSNYPQWYAPDDDNNEAPAALLGDNSQNAYGFFIPTRDIIDAYSSNDDRKDCIAQNFKDTDGNIINARYVKCYVQQTPSTGGRSSGADWYIMRYANVLLYYAEALNENESGNPLNYVNQVRRRAGLSDTTASGQAAIRDIIYLEQRRESPFEGHRWNDLVRTGRALDVMNAINTTDSTAIGPTIPINNNQLIYPLPSRVIATSGVEQNP